MILIRIRIILINISYINYFLIGILRRSLGYRYYVHVDIRALSPKAIHRRISYKQL